jgi:hypothetical protein
MNGRDSRNAVIPPPIGEQYFSRSSDTYYPAAGISGGAQGRCDHSGSEGGRHIRLMLGKVEGLNGLVHDLFELSVCELGSINPVIPLREEAGLDWPSRRRSWNCKEEV